MSIDLKSDVFEPVKDRIIGRRNSLASIKRFPNTGIEGWLKVEVVAALGNKMAPVKSLKNKGPDIILEDGTEIELKAATNFQKGFFVGAIRKYGTPCLFLGEGSGFSKGTIEESML
ncbi:MAG: hypothetical protein B6I30_05730 [Desulfobacteraceae bacterium 4572_187]|nr:MAG: hypothetical protein B6I30_05730 [Desulfobacteraceae bacterium 4572_187]